MSVKYVRLLQAIKIQVSKNGISKVATTALDKILTLSHPNREIAFLDWALTSNLYKQPAAIREYYYEI